MNDYFEALIDVQRMKVGDRQTIETLINEEALLFAKYLINEKKHYKETNIKTDMLLTTR